VFVILPCLRDVSAYVSTTERIKVGVTCMAASAIKKQIIALPIPIFVGVTVLFDHLMNKGSVSRYKRINMYM
jgi:hypothetical protein